MDLFFTFSCISSRLLVPFPLSLFSPSLHDHALYAPCVFVAYPETRSKARLEEEQVFKVELNSRIEKRWRN